MSARGRYFEEVVVVRKGVAAEDERAPTEERLCVGVVVIFEPVVAFEEVELGDLTSNS